ncbi:MAG TPA: MFS transporter [Streptosporangiaceae bacterium]|nr:MFS transporter [Streptosporangiaceae bacterium]
MSEMTGSAGTRPKGAAFLLAILCLANFMATLDLFVVNVALRDIATYFGGSALSNVSWVLNAYAIVFGALLIPAGRAADRFGRKGAFITGLAVFTVASAACAAAPVFWALVGFRCLQAAGAAILVPSSLGLVLTALPPGRVSGGVRAWAVTAAVGGAAGPVIGGLLTEIDWRWIFIVNLPVGVATIAATARRVPVIKHDQTVRIPDPLESLLVIIAVGALSLGLVKGPDWGWGTAGVTACWIVAAFAAVAFALVNRRAETPVVNLALFRSHVFSIASAGMVLSSAAIAMQLLSLSLYLQQSWHWSPLAAGAGIAPGPAFVLIASLTAARLPARLRPRPAGLTVIGWTTCAVGQVLLVIGMDNWHTYGAILPGWVIIGIGIGLAMPTITALGTSDLPKNESAAGSAVVQSGRQLGSVVGNSVLIAVLGSAVATGAASQFIHAGWVTVGAYTATMLISLPLLTRRAATGPPAAAAPPAKLARTETT